MHDASNSGVKKPNCHRSATRHQSYKRKTDNLWGGFDPAAQLSDGGCHPCSGICGDSPSPDAKSHPKSSNMALQDLGRADLDEERNVIAPFVREDSETLEMVWKSMIWL